MSRRAGIYQELEDRLRTGLYSSEQEAVAVLGGRDQKRKEAEESGLFAKELPVVE